MHGKTTIKAKTGNISLSGSTLLHQFVTKRGVTVVALIYGSRVYKFLNMGDGAKVR